MSIMRRRNGWKGPDTIAGISLLCHRKRNLYFLETTGAQARVAVWDATGLEGHWQEGRRLVWR